MSLLSLPSILTGGGFLIPDMPFSESAKWGLGVGLVHGFLMALIIYWYKKDSIVGITMSSIFVTEVLIAAMLVVFFVTEIANQPASLEKPTPSAQNYIYMVAVYILVRIVPWYVILSLLFLIPSFVIGIATKLFVISPKT
ncbi:MAG TPA: hypothetical protein VK612_03400 [Pyrinomonadaceae bacterium]|nr:hypothetical protein [Pyrinomonadaceae bacterium]